MTPYYPLLWRCAVVGFGVCCGVSAFSASSEVLVLPLVPRGAVWRYLDNGSNQGTNWISAGCNDSSWASGPARLGYGGDGEVSTVSYGPNASAKYITTYF